MWYVCNVNRETMSGGSTSSRHHVGNGRKRQSTCKWTVLVSNQLTTDWLVCGEVLVVGRGGYHNGLCRKHWAMYMKQYRARMKELEL